MLRNTYVITRVIGPERVFVKEQFLVLDCVCEDYPKPCPLAVPLLRTVCNL